MDSLFKSIAVSISGIFIGLLILVAVFLESSRNHGAGTVMPAHSPSIVIENWFDERSLALLNPDESELRSIDTQGFTTVNLFNRSPTPPAEEAPPEATATEEPEQPPPPSTRKVPVIYRGLYTTSGGDARAYLSVGGQTLAFSHGDRVAPGWTVQEVRSDQISLGSESGKALTVGFNQEKKLEVPLRGTP
ncbi:MAG: hypothetical protein EA353_11285 [Puniceicoccaceae bacterium]|nr:MAG: hypothetical protein EA353_11285 [Puniceicoccaceae bacterium]